MSQDSAIDLTPREAFEIWCHIYEKVYPDKEEEDRRFDLFKQSLDRAIPSSHATNFQCLADLTEEEFKEVRRLIHQPDCYSSISCKELKQLKAGKHHFPIPIPDPDDYVSDVVAAAMRHITPTEAFRIWRDVYKKEYNQREEELRFGLFKQSLLETIPLDTINFAGFADRTKEEFKEIVNRRNCTNYVSFLELKLCAEYLP